MGQIGWLWNLLLVSEMGRACMCQAQWQVWGQGSENPSPSTESQPVTGHTPVVGQEGWNRLGLREDSAQPAWRGVEESPPPLLPREVGDQEAVPAWNPG